MKGKWTSSALAVGLGLVLCAGLALGQAPDWQRGRGPRAGRGGPAAQPPRWQAGLGILLGIEDTEVKVTNTDDGVTLAIKATDPDALEAVRGETQGGVSALRTIAERAGERFAQGPPPGPGPGGLLRMLAAGDVDVAYEETDEGAVVKFTSDKPEVVQALQQRMPQWVAQAQERGQLMAQMRERMEDAREALALIANEGVTIKVEETEDGITVKVTSEDPDLVAQIKEKLSAYYEGQKELAQMTGRLGAAPVIGPPGGPPAAPLRGPRAAGRRARRGQQD